MLQPTTWSRDGLIKRLVDYIDIASISGDEEAFLKRLEDDFRACGYRTERQMVVDGRYNLLALPVAGPAKILFSTHVDVVPPHIPARVTEDAIWGRGACDTKGGLVAMMAAADRLDPSREFIGFLLVIAEEVDHIGAIVAQELDLKPLAIILCEPTTGHLVSGQKGLLKLRLNSSGEAAHSAFPELGQDALAPLLDSLDRLRKTDYPTDPVLGDTTLNIGTLKAGVAANITPPEATAELLYRVTSDPETLLEQVRLLCSDDVTIETISETPPIALNTVEGFPLENIAFNTDAIHLASLGPVYLMGPGDIRVAHGENEHIPVSALETGVDDYVRLVQTLMS